MNPDFSSEAFDLDVDFGFVDKAILAPKKLHPELVLNTSSNSMLRALRYEMQRASSFTFSVAFVSPRAIALLKQELLNFEGVGRIITSDYLGFNSPQAFAELLNLKSLGFDIRISEKEAFHPKGYVFSSPDGVTAILGSSNLTEGALARNHEWNLRVSAKRDSDLAAQFSNLLDEELFSSNELTQGWIDDYATNYLPPRDFYVATKSASESAANPINGEQIEPNTMQVDALKAIETVRAANKNRALVISATGTGKTMLSAFDVREVNPDRVLFLAHREQILDRSMKAFKTVLGGAEDNFGKIAGKSRDDAAKYVFATVQTLSQPQVLGSFPRDAFDYILIDEVHRAGAESFQRVLEHFTPKFLLGMTATPERSDGKNIFEIFDYNVPYEIRLNSALELGMLAPFHYYGVADLTFEDGTTTTDATSLNRLIAEERVEHILATIAKYAQAGISPRGLIFCSRNDEARELSVLLNAQMLHGKKLRTVALSGSDSIEEREQIVERLEAGDLDYILSVDIFNEGVDIPTLNQVIMLRQTQSSIVFVQQLGRGLRTAPNKEFLVVIDFIGNYANNYMIPIALFGDDSLNKESLRKNLIAAEEAGVISGLSSVSFDQVAQKRVLQSLASVRLDSLHNLKAAIEVVMNRVGRIPKLSDYLKFESVDPVVLATKEGNYLKLLDRLKIEELSLSEETSHFLSFISRELFTAKRPHELLLLQALIANQFITFESASELETFENVPLNRELFESAMRSLTLEFNTVSERAALGGEAVAHSEVEGRYSLSARFKEAFDASNIFAAHVIDLMETGLAITAERYESSTPFTVGRQYSRKDASRLLNWRANMYSTIYGYKVDQQTKTCPVFVTLHKAEDVSASRAYEDELLDPRKMQWFTRSRTSLQTAEVRAIVENQVAIHVFAKQSDADGAGHYYLGRALSTSAVETEMPGDEVEALSVVKMQLVFDEPIPSGLFDYFHATLTN